MINTSGTINLEWFLNQFCAEEKAAAKKAGRTIYDWAEEVAGNIPIGAQGIVYHPYLNTTGVIAPFLNPAARAQFFGVSIEHTRAHLLRAVYEGAALSMLDCYAQIPVEIDEWFISGGGKRSAFWSQMFSDCTGQKILVPEGVEFGARSVAVLAGIACGVYDDLGDAMDQVIRIEREHTPNQVATEKYRQLYELYKAIYEQLQDVWWKRHELVKRWTQ
jgi:xylulokinase/L-xylulokinase